MLKLISWNIDSLNAALTSESPRALLSRDVLTALAKEDADIIAIQETKLPATGPSKKHTEVIPSGIQQMFRDLERNLLLANLRVVVRTEVQPTVEHHQIIRCAQLKRAVDHAVRYIVVELQLHIDIAIDRDPASLAIAHLHAPDTDLIVSRSST